MVAKRSHTNQANVHTPLRKSHFVFVFVFVFYFSGYNSKYTDKQLTRITNNKNFRYGNTKYQTAPKDYPKETVFLSRGSPN